MPLHEILERFNGPTGKRPLFLPNLNLWHEWHSDHGTLPDAWRGLTLPEIARDLGVPAWLAVKPYRIDQGAAEIVTTEADGQRLVRYELPSGVLTERWRLGPDGDWWQTEYPVKTLHDLGLAMQVLEARRYVVETDQLELLRAQVGDDGVVALALPRRPFSQLFLEWLGWSDGLLLFFDAQELVAEIIHLLEGQVQALVDRVARLPGEVVVSPDNLDAQFISPAYFRRYLAASYRRTAETLHAQGKMLLAGTGGPLAALLAPLAQAGVDGIEGVCGPPQSDAGLKEARVLAGPDFTLWGGIPQDALLPAWSPERFREVVTVAAKEAAHDSRAILGIADTVPIGADLSRLRALPSLVARARS
jgi:hypothetical protein